MPEKLHGRVSEETFGDFLAGEGILEACEDQAIKEVIAEQLTTAMQQQGIPKMEMVARMKTSLRLLDPKVLSVILDTLRQAENAVGRRLRLDLI